MSRVTGTIPAWWGRRHRAEVSEVVARADRILALPWLTRLRPQVSRRVCGHAEVINYGLVIKFITNFSLHCSGVEKHYYTLLPRSSVE